jgi:hypothetical protein
MLSHLFFHHKQPRPKFGGWAFLILVGVFAWYAQIHPVFGLTGLGTVLVVATILVELNRKLIWENYRKLYKQRKSMRSIWLEPHPFVYELNVRVLMPILGLLGVWCLWAAYLLSI